MEAAVVAEISALLQKKEIGPVAAWQAVLKVLKEKGLAYDADCKPTMIMCHPGNRSGLGVNARNVHANGMKIRAIGGDLGQVVGRSCAFEMSGVKKKRDEQIEFNKQLVQACQLRALMVLR